MAGQGRGPAARGPAYARCMPRRLERANMGQGQQGAPQPSEPPAARGGTGQGGVVQCAACLRSVLQRGPARTTEKGTDRAKEVGHLGGERRPGSRSREREGRERQGRDCALLCTMRAQRASAGAEGAGQGVVAMRRAVRRARPETDSDLIHECVMSNKPGAGDRKWHGGAGTCGAICRASRAVTKLVAQRGHAPVAPSTGPPAPVAVMVAQRGQAPAAPSGGPRAAAIMQIN